MTHVVPTLSLRWVRICSVPSQAKIFKDVRGSTLLQKIRSQPKSAGQKPHIPVGIRSAVRLLSRDGSRGTRALIREPIEALKRKPFVEVWVADISGSSIVASKCCGDQQCLKVRID